MADKILISCKKCGKRLIERTPNGLWRFLYGRSSKNSNDNRPAVEMLIHGSVQMRCLDRKCRYMNELSMLPNNYENNQSEQTEKKSLDSECSPGNDNKIERK